MDTSTFTVTAANIVSTGDGAFAGATYQYQADFGGVGNPKEIGFQTTNSGSPADLPALVLLFANSLTVAGTDDITFAGEGLCSTSPDTVCHGFGYGRSVSSTGDATTNDLATPEPATSVLVLGGGLAAILSSKLRRYL